MDGWIDGPIGPWWTDVAIPANLQVTCCYPHQQKALYAFREDPKPEEDELEVVNVNTWLN